MKLVSYVQSGKGRGIRFVCLMALLLACVYCGVVYYAGLKLIQLQPVQDFLKSIPNFTIQDGQIQDKTIRWRAQMPLTPMMITVDTTQEELALPVADGVYVTEKYFYSVMDHGTNVNRSPLPASFDVSEEAVTKMLKIYIVSFSVGTALVFFLFSLVFFLILVAITALLGAIARMHLGEGRVWRSSAVAWTLGQILNMIAGLVASNLKMSVLIFVICIGTDLALLFKSKD